MDNFFKGILVGIGLSILFAPMPGQQMRRLLSERLQGLVGALPQDVQSWQSQQSTQEKTSQSTQTTSPSKDNELHIVSEVKDGVNQAKDTIQLVNPPPEQTEHNGTETSNQTTTSVQPGNRRESAGISSSEAVQKTGDPLTVIPDITPGARRRLEEAGVLDTSQLLERTKTKEERSTLINKTGIGERTLRAFVYRADLMRLPGVGEDMAMLLEEAGVNGCKDLQNRNPEHLHAKLEAVQANRSIVTATPDLAQLTAWIAQAKQIAQT